MHKKCINQNVWSLLKACMVLHSFHFTKLVNKNGCISFNAGEIYCFLYDLGTYRHGVVWSLRSLWKNVEVTVCRPPSLLSSSSAFEKFLWNLLNKFAPRSKETFHSDWSLIFSFHPAVVSYLDRWCLFYGKLSTDFLSSWKFCHWELVTSTCFVVCQDAQNLESSLKSIILLLMFLK